MLSDDLGHIRGDLSTVADDLVAEDLRGATDRHTVPDGLVVGCCDDLAFLERD